MQTSAAAPGCQPMKASTRFSPRMKTVPDGGVGVGRRIEATTAAPHSSRSVQATARLIDPIAALCLARRCGYAATRIGAGAPRNT